MFAVPGWSIKAQDLKVEKNTPHSSSKKRKRPSKEGEIVDTTKIAELWSHHIEGKKPRDERRSLSKHEKKKRKADVVEKDGGFKENIAGRAGTLSDRNDPSSKGLGGDDNADKVAKLKPSGPPTTGHGKINKGDKKHEVEIVRNKELVAHQAQSTSGKDSIVQTQPNLSPKLTPLQASMRQKLISSRFRHLNEVLYTTPSASSLELFKTNPEFYGEYHEGFRRQVATWPENPVDSFLRWIRERGPIGIRNYKDIRRKTSQKPPTHEQVNDEDILHGPDSLPRDPRKGICTIVDLGCGDGKLGLEITTTSLQKKLKLKVFSYDLASSAPHINIADIRSLPLQDSSVDVTIFCLALMGTNWIEFVEEAYRVLRWKGECWIAEVASRFAGSKSKRVEHSVGNRMKDKLKPKGKANSAQQVADGDLEELGLAVTTNDKPQNITDVSSFVAVMRRRGFVLHGEPHTGNKMFLQLRFIKASPPRRGKCLKPEKRDGKKKFIEEGDSDNISVEDEAKVLKPCVYKIR